MRDPVPTVKSFAAPDEVLAIGGGVADTVHVGDMVVGRLVLPPGWRWSERCKQRRAPRAASSITLVSGFPGHATT